MVIDHLKFKINDGIIVHRDLNIQDEFFVINCLAENDRIHDFQEGNVLLPDMKDRA